jgi:hypothetical protein
MLLQNNEHTFHVKIQCKKTLEWFEGDFTVKCVLTNAEQVNMALATDRYNGGSTSLPEQFKLFNRCQAELETRVIKSPTWWKESNNGWDLMDSDLIYEVYAEAMKAQTVWAEKLKKKADEAEKAAEKNPAKKEAAAA